VALVLAAGPAVAQLESPLLSRVQVNIVNPGGKSLAMGGAFVSVADDSTAAIANPAGLPQLAAWQLGASGKHFTFEPKLATANFFQASATAAPTLDSIDVYQPKDNATTLEYASLVVPVVQNLTLALFRNVNMRYQLDAGELIGGNYRAFFVNRGVSAGVSLDEAGGLDIQNEQYGLSAGARIGMISVGGGITVNKLRFELTGGPHLFISNQVNLGNPLANDFYFETAVDANVESGRKVGWLLGVRATLDEARGIAIGGVYRKNPEYEMNYAIRAVVPGATPTVLADFECGEDRSPTPVAGAAESACGTFRVPDDFSFGISGRPFPALLLAIEVQRIRYSQLNDGYVPIFAYRFGSPVQRAISRGRSEDGTVPRVGAEYTVALQAGTELNFRAGYFREPSHGTRASLFPDNAPIDRQPDSDTAVDAAPFSQAYDTTFSGGERENHFSVGLGATIARRFSVDVAFDYSKTTKAGVVSALMRF
jgi:hypothetical protein